MTVTYGFYNSLSGDRKYDAIQMSQLFKGVISDGVFQTIGGGLIVTVNAGMVLNVASGRAWFNNTWTDNDAPITVTIPSSEAVLNRIDAVVVEINSDVSVRANTIKVITGTPATTPVAPTMTHTATLNQYPLAHVSVLAGVTSITGDKITNKVGSVDCPFCAGAVPAFDFGPLLTSWQSGFSTWFTNLVNQLSGSQVTNLQAQIDSLNVLVAKLDNYQIVMSVSSNNLIFSIKTLAGGDPSAANPSRFKVGNTIYDLTAAATFTKNAATSWMNMGSLELAGKNVDLFTYAIGETGGAAGLKFGYSRVPYAKVMGDFVNTTTDEKYIAGNWTNFNATDPVTNIGRFRAQLSGTPNFNWSIPSVLVVNRPIYQTDWLSWAPQFTGFSSPPTGNESYKIIDDIVFYHRDVLTNGTSNLTTFTMSFAFKFAAAAANAIWVGTTDNGVISSTPGHMQIVAANSNIGSMFKTFFQGAWTNTGLKNVYLLDFSCRLR